MKRFVRLPDRLHPLMAFMHDALRLGAAHPRVPERPDRLRPPGYLADTTESGDEVVSRPDADEAVPSATRFVSNLPVR